MITRSTLLALALPGALVASEAAFAQRILVPDSIGDVLMEFDAMTGSLINQTAVDLNGISGGAFSTPIEVLEAPNGELWVSDQISDGIFRISADGTTFLGSSPAALDNVRGFSFTTGSNTLVANAGTANGAPGQALVELDGMLNTVASTPIGSPFDVVPFVFNGVSGYLASDINNEDIVFVDGANPANQTIFHDSDGLVGIDFPQQISVRANGNVLVSGFSAPSGIYEYDSTGAQVNYIDTGAIASLSGLRGVIELGNGNLLFTNGSGVHIYDTTTSTISTQVTGVSARFCTLVGGPLSGSIGTNYCTATPNSTGVAGAISASGSATASANNVTLMASNMPSGQFGIFVTSLTQDFVPNVGSGNLCVGGVIGRYQGPGLIQQVDANGEFSLQIDTTLVPQGAGLVAIQPGESWNFQAWHRDFTTTPPIMNTSNLTDAIEITFN